MDEHEPYRRFKTESGAVRLALELALGGEAEVRGIDGHGRGWHASYMEVDGGQRVVSLSRRQRFSPAVVVTREGEVSIYVCATRDQAQHLYDRAKQLVKELAPVLDLRHSTERGTT